MQSTSKIQGKILSRPKTPNAYDVYRAALEWDLTDPIVIESSADFKSTSRWRDRLTPFHHQATNLITFCRRLPVTLLADDVGLGKTISAGLVMSELIARARLSKTLIVCPKVLCLQWKQELESKFDIPCQVATGRNLLSADPDEVGAVITTYNSARLYLGSVPEDRFQMLVLDEAHKLRNLHGTPNAPQVAKIFHKALEDRRFRFVLMLTATPIQNRLWDLYSLVDLLTVARGHQNPFGNPGMFARRFIDDDREKARQLKPAARDEFRNIVYGYMSRVRRGDAQLSFPDRVVQMHKVRPTAAELELIRVVAEPIRKMNKLAQISILQALASSPHALAAQLRNMARNGTVPPQLAADVNGIVAVMPQSAKLAGLSVLIAKLKSQNPDSWRLIVFTTRRETQTTIVNFLEAEGLTVGIINGESGDRNQETIARFRETPPRYRVIVSTEAGSEGVNLQVANVLVNFDLPWNPMIVEQRVGRVQRLGSNFAHVSIFNITLQDTFEEYVVGRLMEKLQMATHAIGDIEALLQSSVDGDVEHDAAESFEDQILGLVLAALAGKDVAEDVRLKERSIDNAKRELEREEANINAMLGSMDGRGYVGPRTPDLPAPMRSMNLSSFTLAAFRMLGARVQDEGNGIFVAEERDGRERFGFDAHARDQRATVMSPQAPAFQRLLKRVVTSGVHQVDDADTDPGECSKRLVRQWAARFGATVTDCRIKHAARAFEGEALLRVRATTAHDSYERLVTCACSAGDHRKVFSDEQALSPPGATIRDAASLGLAFEKLQAAGEADEAIAEFSRFYLERGEIELNAAGNDERRRKKLEDDFTPRLDISLVGLRGTIRRDVTLLTRFSFADGGQYETELTARPSIDSIVEPPDVGRCEHTGRQAPSFCLGRCETSKTSVLKHLLTVSEFSGRTVLPEYAGRCSLSGKFAVADELETSAISGAQVGKSLLKTSALSGRRAEPEHFGKCSFTQADVLKDELSVSELSGKRYRSDEQSRSEISGKAGHTKEFVACAVTGQTIAPLEAEICEVTGKKAIPGILAACEVTGKRVVPALLGQCTATQRRALRSLMVESSLSHQTVLQGEAIQSVRGAYCLPDEAETCAWSSQRAHPDDLRSCSLTGMSIHSEFATSQTPPRLQPLVEMLNGFRRTTDEETTWREISERLSKALKGGKCRVEAAVLSPSRKLLAVCSEHKSMLGLRMRQVGAIYDIVDDSIIGRLAEGRRSVNGWAEK